MKASDLFVRCLDAEGARYVFGVPGEENADFMMSLEDGAAEFVLCRHEQSAAFMADVYGRLTGRASVCLATLGPGATNLVTGVADANMDRSPVVVVTGQAGIDRLHKESHQNMDVVAMFRPLTKWAQTVHRPDTIPEIVRKAFKTAEAEKPGATVVELPEDVAEAETEGTPLPVHRTRRAGADHRAVEQAVAAIAGARNPIVLAGNGAIRKRASAQLRRFAALSGIGVVNTFMGKGAVPRSDPHCLYTIGLQGGDYVNCAIDEADLVICIGYDLVEYGPAYWNRGTPTPIVHIDFTPAEIDRAYPVAVEVVADIADALWQINERLERDHAARLPLFDIARRAGLRSAIADDIAAEAADTTFPMKPQRILCDVRAAMGPDDVLLSDVGAHKMWVARYYQCDEPNTCLISNGFCSMGFALPGAIGAALARPGKRVLALCGDAGVPDERAGAGDGGAAEGEHRGDGVGRRRVRPHQVEAAEPLRRPPRRPRLRQSGLREAGRRLRHPRPDGGQRRGAGAGAGRGVRRAGAGAGGGCPSTTTRTASSPSGSATSSARSERGRGGEAAPGVSADGAQTPIPAASISGMRPAPMSLPSNCSGATLP